MPSRDLLRQHLLAAAERRQMSAFTELFQAVTYALEMAAEQGTTKAQERTVERIEDLMVEVAHFFDGYAETHADHRDRLGDE